MFSFSEKCVLQQQQGDEGGGLEFRSNFHLNCFEENQTQQTQSLDTRDTAGGVKQCMRQSTHITRG